MFSRKFDRRAYLLLVVVLCSGAVGVTFGFYALWPANVERGYEPEQPIAFSHALHAGQGRLDDGRKGMEIPCLYCHSNAETSAHATVPDVSTCMKCHSEVQPQVTKLVNDHGQTEEVTELNPEIAKLIAAHENNQPIEWIKVHDLADFAYFDHSRHLASGLDCSDCHGAVEKMDRVQRVHSLKMSWCLDCHREKPTEITSELYRNLGNRGPTHCSACHR